MSLPCHKTYFFAYYLNNFINGDYKENVLIFCQDINNKK